MGDLRWMTDKLRSFGMQSVVAAIAGLALILACAGQSQAQSWRTARKPQGLYAHVDLHFVIHEYLKAHGGVSTTQCPLPTTVKTELRKHLKNIYHEVLKNGAVAGIVVGAHWCLIGGPVETYDFSWLDDAFAAAGNKTVQLLIVPGVDSPSGLFGNPGQSCDPAIQIASPNSPYQPNSAYQNCVWVTFQTLPEPLQTPDNKTLPLPWSPVYSSAWLTLLQTVQQRYGNHPQFVSIAVAGPVSVSTEMIMPTSANKSEFQANPGLKTDKGWQDLVENSFQQDPNKYSGYWGQAFIDSWKRTIREFEQTFFSPGVTLILTPDDGANMPELPFRPVGKRTKKLVSTDCSLDKDIRFSCDLKAIVLSDFVAAKGPNEKAVMVGGFTASSQQATGDIGLPGVKALTSMTMPQQSPPILGGAEFDFAVSTNDTTNTQKEGCIVKGCTATFTPPQAAYNVLGNFFSGTVAATNYGGTQPGSSPLHFLVMEYQDIEYANIEYANNNPCMQALIDQASRDLLATAGKAPFQKSPPQSCWLP